MIPTASASKIFSQRLLLILGIATVLALFFATKDYLGQREMGRTVTLGKDVWWKAMEWYGWALLSPAIFWVCRQNDFRRGRWRMIAIHLAFGVVVALAHSCIVATGARIEAGVMQTGLSWWRLFKLILVLYFH